MALCSCSDTVRPSAGCPDVRSTSRGQSQQVSGHTLCTGSRAPRTGTTGPSPRLGPTARRCPFSVEILRGPQSRAVAREPRAPAHQCHRGVHRRMGGGRVVHIPPCPSQGRTVAKARHCHRRPVPWHLGVGQVEINFNEMVLSETTPAWWPGVLVFSTQSSLCSWTKHGTLGSSPTFKSLFGMRRYSRRISASG